MPRAPHSSALLAGRPSAKRRVLAASVSRWLSMRLEQRDLDAGDMGHRRQRAHARAPRQRRRRVRQAGAGTGGGRQPLQRGGDAGGQARVRRRRRLCALFHRLSPCFSTVANRSAAAIVRARPRLSERSSTHEHVRSDVPDLDADRADGWRSFTFFSGVRNSSAAKQLRQQIDNLRRGDTVVTARHPGPGGQGLERRGSRNPGRDRRQCAGQGAEGRAQRRAAKAPSAEEKN